MVQTAATQVVPLAQSLQLPDPSQVPSKPQPDCGACGHWLATAGAAPAGTSEQVPTFPASAHDWQVPLQAMSQQTPCEQLLELHSLPITQVTPVGFLPHVSVLCWHEFGGEQSAVVVATVQEVLHADIPSHRKGSHALVDGGLQCPTPSQKRCGVKLAVPLGQMPFAHEVAVE